MIYFRVYVHESGLPKYLKDPVYTKIELTPSRNKGLKPDIYFLRCFIKSDTKDLTQTISSIRNAITSKKDISKEDRESLGGYLAKLKRIDALYIKELQALYDMSVKYGFKIFIPKRIKIYLEL